MLFVGVPATGSIARFSKLNLIPSPQIVIVDSCANMKFGSFAAAVETELPKRQKLNNASPEPFASNPVEMSVASMFTRCIRSLSFLICPASITMP